MGSRRYAILGMAAPAFFAVSVIALSLMRSDYSHVYHTISELGEAGAANAQVAGAVFVITGLMLVVYGYGLHLKLQRDDKRVWSGVCVILYGLLDFVGSGLFPVDQGGAAATVTAGIHVTATVLGELAALAMPIAFLIDTESIDKWTPLRGFSKTMTALSIPLTIFLVYAITENTPGAMDSPIGLAQRMLVSLLMTWTGYTAHIIHKTSKDDPVRPP